jgi:HK97 family phage prohead protease
MSAVEQLGAPERFFLVAPIEQMEVRDTSANHDNTWTMSGYAAVFHQRATLYDSAFERMTVEIDPHAFDRVLNGGQALDQSDGVVHFNHGHDMKTAVAATDVPKGRPGSLELTRDNHGLRFLARVSRDDPDAVSLASKMRTGVVKQASFAFTTSSDKYTTVDNEDGPIETHRLIMEMDHIYDVCAATQGVFHQTISQLQTYAKLLGQPEQGGRRRQPDLGGATPVSPETGGKEDITPLIGYSVDLATLFERSNHVKPFGGNTEGIRDVRSGQHSGEDSGDTAL